MLCWLAGLELPDGILSMAKPGSTGESQPLRQTCMCIWPLTSKIVSVSVFKVPAKSLQRQGQGALPHI